MPSAEVICKDGYTEGCTCPPASRLLMQRVTRRRPRGHTDWRVHCSAARGMRRTVGRHLPTYLRAAVASVEKILPASHDAGWDSLVAAGVGQKAGNVAWPLCSSPACNRDQQRTMQGPAHADPSRCRHQSQPVVLSLRAATHWQERIVAGRRTGRVDETPR